MVHGVSRGVNRPIVTIEGSAMRSGLDLIGEDKIYDKSEPGAATLQFFRAGTTDVVLLIDEVDKMGKDARDGNCFNALLSLLEGYDTYLEGCLDLSSTLVFATANSLYGIPDAVVNRFEVIHIPDFDFERKIKIAEEYSVPKLLRKYHLSEDELKINNDVLEMLARQYCSDAGMRDMLKYLEILFQKVLVKNGREEMFDMPREEVLDTLLHETHHAYVHKAVQSVNWNDKNIEENKELRLYKDLQLYKQGIDNYISADVDPDSYYNNPIEVAAREYAEEWGPKYLQYADSI